MNAGFLITTVYWVIFTVRKHFTPKVTAAKWALRIAGWAENVLAVLMIVWLAFLIGALITGTTFVFGYPV